MSQIDEIQILLDDHILKCVTMRGSIYLKYIEKRFKVTKNDHTSKIDHMMIKMITILKNDYFLLIEPFSYLVQIDYHTEHLPHSHLV